ncbi:hypothetical protein BU17DRAFT_92092 [Hysterangium stoloniferum]|nr:hypothetical protein BU17DRAFT_92092 [Hysterangium stoloniferum]
MTVDPGHGKVTFINLDDYKAGLDAARNWVPEFKRSSVSEMYDGKKYTFNFYYPDPWQWILSLVTDATLAKHLIWYLVKKYLHDSNIVTQLYDDIDSGKSWWDIQTFLTVSFLLLGLHPHEIVLSNFRQADGNPGESRQGDVPNGSGNGGAVLYLMMPMVEDPHDPKSRTEAQRAAFAFFKRSIYHQVLMVALQPLQYPSQYGEAVTCSDSVQWVLTTGIIIQSVDVKKQHALVVHGVLQLFILALDVVQKAKTARSKRQTEEILRDNGLHIVDKNAFWTIANSDPYFSVSYDTLHSDDLGKWGDHLFPKMIEVLGNMKQGGKFSEFMSHIPSWPGLKIVHNVITVDFSDGNTFQDIMKTTLPCIVQLFPSKSSFIHCIRALATFRMFAGLHMITTLQLDRMQAALCEYEKYCEAVSKEYGKDFHFPNQYAPSHLHYDITHKGSTTNYTTRTGEGFQQESHCAYFQTNYKNVESQIITIDANKEALAYIAMDVEIYDNELKELKALCNDNNEENKTSSKLTAPKNNNHWKLGAPQHHMMTSKMSIEFPNNHMLHTLTADISNVVHQYLVPDEIILTGYKIIPYKCVYIHYTSLEDWKVKQDIARCNPSFHGCPQYDSPPIDRSYI